MKNRSGEKIKLASIDELLGVVNEESANIIGSVISVDTMFISPREPNIMVKTLNIAFLVRISTSPFNFCFFFRYTHLFEIFYN